MKTTGKLPGWLPLMNRVTIGMNKLGLRLGPVVVLTVPGRKTGVPRSTPVTPFTVDGARYLTAGLKNGDWARNVRAAGRGRLSRGRHTSEMAITEVTDPEQRRHVFSQFPVQVPRGVPFFVSLGLVTKADPAEFAAAADDVAVFALGEGR
jgi:deazaflavin-dependent oxidoreductase (nitroreductase family)